jgi:uncharacterized protein YecE (DUF72 family)
MLFMVKTVCDIRIGTSGWHYEHNWHKQTPKDFLFTVKASRFITHIKKLKDVEEPLEKFFNGIRLLKTKLGPILYQLPPSMHNVYTILFVISGS